EMAARVAELGASVAKHVADKGDEALDADTKAAVGLYGQVTDAKLKARLVGVVGGILKGIAHESTQLAALHALGEMADPAGAAFVGPFLVQPDTRKSPPLIEAAVEAASRLK